MRGNALIRTGRMSLAAAALTLALSAAVWGAESAQTETNAVTTVSAAESESAKTETEASVEKTAAASATESAGWHMSTEGRYYILNSGSRAKGWLEIDGAYYYFKKTTGIQRTGWLTVKDTGRYYLDPDNAGARVTGMKKINGYTYFFNAEGVMQTGWVKYNNYMYYFKSSGRRVTGMKKIDGKVYYFSKKGRMQTGWLTYNGKRYYFKKNKGYRVTGFKKIGKKVYYFNSKGVMQTGWVSVSDSRYYLNAKGVMQTGWLTYGGEKYYLDPDTGKMATGQVTIDGTVYEFNSDGVMQTNAYAANGRWYGPDGNAIYTSTIRNLLKTALKPVGTTLYVWGGGWLWTANSYGDYSYYTAKTIGTASTWEAFFNKQNASYDYTTTRWQQANGLDCSGYVGWVIYNTFNRVSGNAGYVRPAQYQARIFAGFGWGKYSGVGAYSDFKAGDIMSLAEGHVYIVVGQCADGSVVLLHSSPPGVMLTGTTTADGSKTSQAIKLAKKYMSGYYPVWYARYSAKIWRGTSYLTDYSQMRWYITSAEAGGTPIMTDPDGYRNMSAAQILKDLFA